MARYPQYEPIYQAAADFTRLCLVADRSLLWPEREVWSIAALEELRRRFVEGFIQGRMPFREKLEAQLGGAPAAAWAVLADCFYLYGLPSRTMRPQTKKGWVEWAAGRAGLALPTADAPVWLALREGFAPTGQKYNLKHAQLRLLVLLALEVKAAPDRERLVQAPRALQDLLDGLLEAIPLKIDRANDIRNALLYMLFPDNYEPILSNQDKDAILRHYAGSGGNTTTERGGAEHGGAEHGESGSRDAALRQVRERLAPIYAGLGRPFDFYLDAREDWRPAAASLPREAAPAAARGHGVREPAPSAQWPSTAAPDVRAALAALRLTRNLILSGPPGTGKTYIAGQVARALVTGQPGAAEDYTVWVTLHASYAYEDFVEGLRPVLAAPGETRRSGAERGLGYEIRPGVFLEAAAKAAADPDHTYVLVLDEINRGNLAKILGELISLIEDDKRGTLSARLVYSGARFSVPPNLLLLGTMNTADRSIALLDAALRRRFAFVEIPPRPELLAGAVIETDEAAVSLEDLLRCLNAALSETLGPDHQIGHSYFLRVAQAAPEQRLTLLELVWNTQVAPLLEEYFYAHPDRLAELLAPFVEEGDSASSAGPTGPAPQIHRLAGDDLVVALSRLCERMG